jgi:DnaJ family protein A protein 1
VTTRNPSGANGIRLFRLSHSLPPPSTHHHQPRQFKDISWAYSILSSDEKRAMYDRGGESALKEGGGGGRGGMGDPRDIFDMFFGGGGGGSGNRRPTTKSIVHELSLSLEEIYKGRSVKLAVQRKILCQKCEGSGSKRGRRSSTSGACPTCHGQVCGGAG